MIVGVKSSRMYLFKRYKTMSNTLLISKSRLL
jgi:hypothetical protein